MILYANKGTGRLAMSLLDVRLENPRMSVAEGTKNIPGYEWYLPMAKPIVTSKQYLIEKYPQSNAQSWEVVNKTDQQIQADLTIKKNELRALAKKFVDDHHTVAVSFADNPQIVFDYKDHLQILFLSRGVDTTIVDTMGNIHTLCPEKCRELLKVCERTYAGQHDLYVSFVTRINAISMFEDFESLEQTLVSALSTTGTKISNPTPLGDCGCNKS